MMNQDDIEREIRLRAQLEAQHGIWSSAWETIAKINPAYLEGYLAIQKAAQSRQRLPPKYQQLCYVAVAASVTHMYLPAVEAHIRAALEAGATTDEIFETLGLSYLLGVHTVTLGFPMLQELMEELGIQSTHKDSNEEDRKDEIRKDFVSQRGFWPETFEPLLDLDPEFFARYTDFSSFSSRSKVLEPKYRELLICAIDAATTHLYARGTKIHMRNALKLGALPEEIVEMLEITSLMGIDGICASTPILYKQIRHQ